MPAVLTEGYDMIDHRSGPTGYTPEQSPPIELYLDELHTDIEPTDAGMVLITPLARIELTETLVARLAINALARKRRADRAAS